VKSFLPLRGHDFAIVVDRGGSWWIVVDCGGLCWSEAERGGARWSVIAETFFVIAKTTCVLLFRMVLMHEHAELCIHKRFLKGMFCLCLLSCLPQCRRIRQNQRGGLNFRMLLANTNTTLPVLSFLRRVEDPPRNSKQASFKTTEKLGVLF
jgi:hypothetical protein